MSLNPAFSSACATATDAAPDAKLTFNVNAFNGNKTNFGGGSAPKPKSMMATTPVQPMRDMPSLFPLTTKPRPGMTVPL